MLSRGPVLRILICITAAAILCFGARDVAVSQLCLVAAVREASEAIADQRGAEARSVGEEQLGSSHLLPSQVARPATPVYRPSPPRGGILLGTVNPRLSRSGAFLPRTVLCRRLVGARSDDPPQV